MRFSVEGLGQQIVPLKTTIKDEADKRAQVKAIEIMHDINNDNYSGNRTFEKVADEYLQQRRIDAEGHANPKRALANYEYEKRTIDLYLKHFFKKKRNSSIAAIKPADVNKYIEWRRAVWTTGEADELKLTSYNRNGKKIFNPKPKGIASQSTLKREGTAFNGVFKYAVHMGYIRNGDRPEYGIKNGKSKKRPYFTKAQIETITKLGALRIYQAIGDKRLQFERRILLHYIHIAVGSGLRKSEMLNLNWEDIIGLRDYYFKTRTIEEYLAAHREQTVKSDLRFKVHGKNIDASEVVPKEDVIQSLSVLYDSYRDTFGDGFNISKPVFMNFEGKRLASFDKSLNALLKAAKITEDQDGRKFSSYCFRHSYATWELQKNPPTDVYVLSINMRTSVKMIQDYYGKVVAGDHHASLSKSNEMDVLMKGLRK